MLHQKHQDELDWTVVSAQLEPFRVYMSEPNGDRKGSGHTQQSIDKAVDRVLDCLAYAAIELEHSTNLSFKTLVRATDDFEIFESFIANELVARRGNRHSTIVQAVGHLKHGLGFCKWRNWIDDADFNVLVTKLDNLKTSSSSSSDRPKKKHKPAEVPPPLGDACTKTTAFVDKVLANWQADKATAQEQSEQGDYELISEHCYMLQVALMFELTFQRGGRSIDLARATVALTQAFAEQALDADESDSLFLVQRDGKSSHYIYTKGHYMQLDGADSLSRSALTLLEELFFECATWIQDGASLFTPDAHGTQFTKAQTKYMFTDAGKFSDYFRKECTKHLDFAVRPNKARSMVSTHFTRSGASEALMRSQATRYGGSVENMMNVYNSQSSAELGHDSAIISKFQFDKRFMPSKNTVGVTAVIAGVRQVHLARYIRQHEGKSLHALFKPTASFLDSQELSANFVALDPSKEFPNMQVLFDGVKQVCRSPVVSVKHAANELTKMGYGDSEMIDDMVAGPISPIVGDMVAVPHMFTFGEVVSNSNGTLGVALAVQVNNSAATTNRAYFKFKFGTEPTMVDESECIFPLDLTFHGADEVNKHLECTFELRKTEAQETV